MWCIRNGATRRVVLTKHYAIKFARTGITALLVLPYRLLVKKDTEQKIHKYTKDVGFVVGALRYLYVIFTNGIRANLHEKKVFHTIDGPFAPVLDTHLWGIILVMVRGECVSDAESKSLRMQYSAHDLRDRPDHVFRFGERYLFVDYGNPDDVKDFVPARPTR